MNYKAAITRVKSIVIEDLFDLMEELSDQEAGACVGGLEINTPLLSSIIDPIVSVDTSAEVLDLKISADTNPDGSLRIGRRG
ncbi:MAG TPA: hypothetical protein V6C95_05875 [Coleofasciculaceae cyanobacterium]